MELYLGKIPVRIQPFFWLLMGFIGWINTQTIQGTIVWMAVIFVSVLVHELGHALTAIHYGSRAEIELFAMGGITHRKGPPLKLSREFLVVLNGPLAGFALCALAILVRKILGEQPMSLFIYAIEITIYINLFWTIVNLLPIQPLDGGHLLRIFLEGLFGVRGVKIAMFIGVLLGAIFSVLFMVFGAFLVGAIFFMFTFESYRNWRQMLTLTDSDQNNALQKRFKEAENEMNRGHFDYAYSELKEMREETGKGVIFMGATELMAQILYEKTRYQEAYDLLAPHLKKLSEKGLHLLHELAYRNEKWEEAISLGNRMFQYYPNYETAVINALCHAVLGQNQPAIGWLKTALDQGLPNLPEVVNRREFDHLRSDPQIQTLLTSSP